MQWSEFAKRFALVADSLRTRWQHHGLEHTDDLLTQTADIVSRHLDIWNRLLFVDSLLGSR
jgi:hypothetical protein